jgi:threonine dehydratase
MALTRPDARALLRRYFPPTPLVRASSLGRDVYLKLETELPTGSFKVRGALVALRRQVESQPVGEVIASSTGNHGAAVAYAAQRLGVPCTIFVPERVNPTKRQHIVDAGARLVEQGRDIAEAYLHARAYARKDGVFFLNDATDPYVPDGTATIAAEIFEQLPEARTIYVPVGDTALIRGIASAARRINSGVKMIGVQAVGAPSYYLSWIEGRPHPTETCVTIADGLATRTPEAANVQAIRDLVGEMLLVTDEQMIAAIRHLLQEENVRAEPAGAAATAAFMQRPSTDPTVLVVSGANISVDVLRRALQ